jgi:hypothetical protein
MKKTILASLVLVAALSCAQALAQTTPTLTFTAETTTGAGSVVPKLTWATTPAATSCTASGDPAWTGTKAASGTQTLAAITMSKTYRLTCTWPGSTTATLSWVAPTTNTDGTALAKCAASTDSGPCLAKYRISRGASATALTDTRDHNFPLGTTATWTGLAAGTHFFGIKAVTGDGVESALSNVVSKVVNPTATVDRDVAITVNPQPNPPTNLSVE